jgi:hypothetical protein
MVETSERRNLPGSLGGSMGVRHPSRGRSIVPLLLASICLAGFASTVASAQSTDSVPADGGDGAEGGDAIAGTDDVNRVRLSWTNDAATTMTLRWAGPDDAPARARVRPAAAPVWQEYDGAVAGSEYEVIATGLVPNTQYEYELALSGDRWDATARTFRTAPLAGPFEAVFVADTGINGRTDGLATGTRQVIDEITALDPLVVLGGGDYAYFNSEDRFADLDGAIDGWLQQMEPAISTRAFMPTYGNHEVLLDEDVNQWIDRLATPAGTPDRSSYSFDVAGVHFVALLAYQGQVDDVTEAWLRSDLEAAQAAGAGTIIPYFHRNTYGDGTVHPPSPSLGRQLSGIFEEYGVDVVLNAHDQSYERTYPLIAGSAVSSRRDCVQFGEGITWVKTSPGGKVSNVSWNFSSYSATPPNPTIAVRNATLHHYSKVRVEPTGDIEVITYGVAGDGKPPVQVDRVFYTGECPTDEFAFTTLPVSLDVDAGDELPGVDVEIVGASPLTELASTAEWILPGPIGADGVATLTFVALPLEPGTHTAEVRASIPGRDDAVLSVVVRVHGNESDAILLASLRPGRSAPVVLNGARLSGTVFVSLNLESRNVGLVRFFANGRKIRADRDAPFDLTGGSAISAGAWETTNAVDGEQTVEAVIVDSEGRTTRAFARFAIDNASTAGQPAAIIGEPYVFPDDTGDEPFDQPVVVPLPADVATTSEQGSWWSSWKALLGGSAAIGFVVALAASMTRRRPAT